MNALPPNRQQEIVEGPPAWARLATPLALLELVGACVLIGSLVARFALESCSSHGCAILFVIVVLPAGVLGGVALLVVRNLLVREMRTRVMVDVVLAMAALVWWNAGQRVEETQARLELQQEQSMRAIERAAAGTEDHYGRDRFLDGLRRSGSHGPPGVVPAVLRVQDDGSEVEVELLDTLAAQYPVGLARVLPDPAARPGWRGCPMQAAGAARTHGAFLLRPREPVRFTLPAPCAAQFRSAPLEFRVGTWKLGTESPGWWSDSAIAAPDGWPEPVQPTVAPQGAERTQAPIEIGSATAERGERR